MSELAVDLSEMTVDELLNFKENIEKGYAKLCDDRARDLAKLGDDFDPYTVAGEKKIKKIIQKYQDQDDGFIFLLHDVLQELKQRQVSIEDIERKESEKLSDEEYIYREIKKTKQYKSSK